MKILKFITYKIKILIDINSQFHNIKNGPIIILLVFIKKLYIIKMFKYVNIY